MQDKKQEEPRMTQACESKARNEVSLRTKREYSARDTQSGEGLRSIFGEPPLNPAHCHPSPLLRLIRV